MSIPMIIFAIVLIVCSVALITVVVLQSNRGSEMAALTGRNNNASGKGASAKRDMFLKRLTVGLGLVFVVAVFVLDVVIAGIQA
ncbi:MAG: preprotein translocase subunit SecG [Clostridia bacterium]|nr:preprotein translocase subunit SecG [Clostridia bacterium]